MNPALQFGLVVALCTAAPAWANHHPGHVEEHHHGHGMMEGTLGGYSMNRDASGTSWQPESTPMGGVHSERIAQREGLKDAIRRMLQHDGPALLEADTPVVPA